MFAMTLLEFLSKWSEALGIVAICAASVTVLGVTGILAWFSFRFKRYQIEAELKMEMVTRGMSSEEITEVLSADLSQSLPRHHHRPPPADAPQR
jgi:hypothetical protein